MLENTSIPFGGNQLKSQALCFQEEHEITRTCTSQKARKYFRLHVERSDNRTTGEAIFHWARQVKILTSITPAPLSCLVCLVQLPQHQRIHLHWSDCWVPPVKKQQQVGSRLWEPVGTAVTKEPVLMYLAYHFIVPHSLGLHSVTSSSVHSKQTCRHPLPSSSSPAPAHTHTNTHSNSAWLL